jgi:hypothetical protein
MAHRPEESTGNLSSSPPQGAPKNGEKKKRKYSKNLKGAQQFERRISKSAHRVSQAVEKGLDTYLDERDKSRERRRDGALIESYVNVARGLEEGITKASPVVVDLAKAVNSKRTRRFLRSVARSFPRVR